MKAPASSLSSPQALAVAVGNALEFYDFVTYAFFAAQIGRTFFPSNTAGLSLLSSLATFGVVSRCYSVSASFRLRCSCAGLWMRH
jgi:hypothetical protein